MNKGRRSSCNLEGRSLDGQWAAIVFLIVVCMVATAPAQSGPSAQLSPHDLVRAAVDNEVTADKDTSVKHEFRSHKETAHGSQTKLYVETREGMAGMVIANNDQPLTPEQLQGEENHLDGLLHDPEQLRNKQAREKEDAEHTLRIVKALPDAFVYEYAGTVNAGTADPVIRLQFHPNPDYSPPSRVEQVLTAMKGDVLIDERSRRLVKIDGTLFKDVSFGWSILGHLNQGGHFLVEQADCGDGTWQMTHMKLSFTGKILLFKSLNISADESFSGFHRVPSDTTFAQGVDMLKKEQERLGGDAAPSNAKKIGQTESAAKMPR